MFDSQTLHIGELAERWKKTPRQILDLAQGLRVPLYFHFEGLAFDVADRFHRHGGDMFEARKLEALSDGINRNETWIRRSARGETGQWEQRLSSEEAQELRAKIEADKEARAALVELLEKRQQDRQKMFYRGFMRAGPSTLFAIAAHEAEPFPRKAFHPHSSIKVVTLTDARHDGEQIWEGRMMALESLPGYESRPAKPLTADDLYAMTVEVKAIESWWKSEQADAQPQAGNDAPVVEVPESQQQRQDRRLKACIDAGLPMNAKAALSRLPDGVGNIADSEGVTRQAFSTDVKAALNRREAAKREGSIMHRA